MHNSKVLRAVRKKHLKRVIKLIRSYVCVVGAIHYTSYKIKYSIMIFT